MPEWNGQETLILAKSTDARSLANNLNQQSFLVFHCAYKWFTAPGTTTFNKETEVNIFIDTIKNFAFSGIWADVHCTTEKNGNTVQKWERKSKRFNAIPGRINWLRTETWTLRTFLKMFENIWKEISFITNSVLDQRESIFREASGFTNPPCDVGLRKSDV